MRQNVIIGAGLSGMSTAFHLGRDYELFEKEAQPGGLVITHERQGFHFDVTGHWLHMRDNGIRDMVQKLMPGKLTDVTRDSRIFSKGVYTLYPFQTNTFGLPVETVKEIIQGFIKARYETVWSGEPATFEEWVLRHMGEGIAKHFMIPYNEKLWLTHPRDMTPLWCQIYVPKPTLDQILDGALRPPTDVIGYNASFTYPKKGGIGALSAALAKALPQEHLHYNVHPLRIDAKKRCLTLSDGRSIGYKNLVSTMPLDELIPLIADAPLAVRTAATKLVKNQVYYFNVGLNRKPGNGAHWIYFPEKPFTFYRAGCYSSAVPSMAPKGGASLYVEISHRGQLPPQKALWQQVEKGLMESGFLRSRDDVVFVEGRNIPCAYVVFDANWKSSLDRIFPWLTQHGIHSIGRYGRWTYNSMETALIDGRETARAITDGPTS